MPRHVQTFAPGWPPCLGRGHNQKKPVNKHSKQSFSQRYIHRSESKEDRMRKNMWSSPAVSLGRSVLLKVEAWPQIDHGLVWFGLVWFGLTMVWFDLRLTRLAAGIVKWIIMELGWDFNGALLNQITERNVHHGDPHKARAVVGWRPSFPPYLNFNLKTFPFYL